MKPFTGKRIFTVLAVAFLAMVMMFSASALDEEYTVKSLSVENLTLIENYDGYYEEEKGTEYFLYNTCDNAVVTVTYSDGTVEKTDFISLSMMFYDDAVIDDGQSAKTPWTVGNYTVKYNFMGFEGEYEVEVVESPVEKITVEPFDLIYRGDGETDWFSTEPGGFYYYTEPKRMTVYYKDGRTLSGSAEGIYELTGYEVIVDDGQYNGNWGIGKYKCIADFMGAKAEYTVTVKASDVKKIEVENVTLYEGIDGWWDFFSGDKDDFSYNVIPEKVTIYYKDGTAFTGSPDEIEKHTGYAVDYDTDTSLPYGKNTARASYLGASTTFIATVKPYPISNVKLIKAPDKTEYYGGEFINPDGAVLRVTYTDGKTEDVELKCDFTGFYSMDCYLQKLGKTVEIPLEECATIANTTAFYEFLDNEFTIPYKVKTNKITDAALSVDSNGFPVIDFTFSDNSTKKSYITDIPVSDIGYLGEDDCTHALILTDLGLLDVVIYKKGNTYAIEFYNGSYDEVFCTEYCEVNWAVVTLAERAGIIYNNYEGVDAYKGLVATDNIDTLLSFAAHGSNAGKPKAIYDDYLVYTATEMQKSVKDFFALDGIDITCSKNFDSKTNTVKVKNLDKGWFYSYDEQVKHPVSYTFKDGFFKVEYTFTDGKKMELNADSKGRIVSYKVLDPVVHKHIMVTVSGVKPTYLKTGLTDGVKCSTCGEILTQQKTVDKLVLGKTAKIVSAQNTNTIKITWAKVKDATGYELFYKTASGWKNYTTTTANTETFKGLPSGKKYAFAVRAYVIENGKVIKASGYTAIETATQPKAPSKVISKQNSNAIQLQWATSTGATGYKIYYKTATGWKSPGQTAKTVATFGNLSAGSKFTFAIRPFIIVSGGVIWGDPVYYNAATIPQATKATVASTVKGVISLKFSTVRGADAYQIYYKKGNGSYKLYKNYATAGTVTFSGLKSGDSYTFAVRCATKTGSGWIYSSYNPVTVKVK